MQHEASVRAVVDSWRRRAPGRESIPGLEIDSLERSTLQRTELSATVFSGDAPGWMRYLRTPVATRYEPGAAVRAHLQPDLRLVAFEPENEDSRWLAQLLDQTLRWVRQRAEHKPNVRALLDELLFAHCPDAGAPARIVLCRDLPSTGTREVDYAPTSAGDDTRFVLSSRLVRDLHEILAEGAELSADEKLGLAWPLAARLLSQIAYPTSPRDRFVAKIDGFARLIYLALNVLYEESRSGRLVANGAGVAFELLSSDASNVERSQLFERHPYFRMLSKVSFLLRARPYASYAEEARIAAREYLDTVYLHLNLASAMPDPDVSALPMEPERKKGKVRTPKPRVGQNGILDEEDRSAWKKVADPFRDIGFVLLRQIGVGDFGRVYEVLNEHNSHFPARLALKVDRISGRKKQAILEAEAAMRVGCQLSHAPHLVRLYDTGKLRGKLFTYHVLQLIDGETLDNLIQVVGGEHASTGRPPSTHTSERQAREEYERSVRLAQARGGLVRRVGRPFRYPLSTAMVLDVLTHVLLTVEEAHALGYAMNDLKNDNLMMSRRGQIKGIDLDSFSRICTPHDQVTDFLYLAAALILLLLNAPSPQTRRIPDWQQLAGSETLLRKQLALSPLADVEVRSDGRVSSEELHDLLVGLVRRCHQLSYIGRRDEFSADISRLIDLGRRLLAEELVID